MDGTPPRAPKGCCPRLTNAKRSRWNAAREALRADLPDVADLRRRRGIGSDMLDELDQFYELKMSSSAEFQTEITLTREEVRRAHDPDFFLVLVAGLEDADGDLRVRFIFNPLRLMQRITGEITVSGVRDAEALEYRFRAVR